MTRSATIAAIASTLLVAQIAAAQMMGGGNHGSSPSTPGSPAGGMNGASAGRMMRGASMLETMESLTIGNDGVAYVVRASDASTPENRVMELIAIRPAGTVAWTVKLDGQMLQIALADNLVLVAASDHAMGMRDRDAADDDASSLTAISTSTGSRQWQTRLDGRAIELKPVATGVYAITAKRGGSDDADIPLASSEMTRSLVSIDRTGKVLWTLKLN
jgi:outer membrane protein assembly factor BamB